MSVSQTIRHHNKLLMGTALVGAFLSSYARRAYAGNCVGVGGIFTCLGPAGADTTQTLSGTPLAVTTTAGFGITTAVGDAFSLTGTNGISFTDTFSSTITGATNGITAFNQGSGALSITTTGLVTVAGAATYNGGILALNNTSSTDLTIHAAGISGGADGISGANFGSGALSITGTGAVTVTTTGTNTTGIYAYNGINGTDLTIHAADVSGGADGISAANFGRGALSITTTGLVTGSGTAPYNGGIVAFNATSGSDLTIQAAAVSGGSYGIYAQNGSGALSITTTGRVESSGTATYNAGILAYNTVYGTNLTIAVADVSGANYGIFATNFGFGALSITATGKVIGTGRYGIVAQDYLGVTDLTITAADVSGGDDGIRAAHQGSGALSITTTGAVTGSGRYGIFTTDGATGTQTLITVGATGSVAGANAGINAVSNAGQPIAITNAGTISNLAATPTTLAIATVDGPTTIANNGLVLGTVALGNLADSFNNAATATWNTASGSNDFGAGIDAVDNDGTLVAAANAGAAETTTFANLETFLNNASGILTLQDGGTGDALVFSNNYVGSGGRLLLDTFLAGDGSPSDRLVIDGGTATGSTGMIITNVGGAGALTTGNGILVVDDTMGQTTAPGAFHLARPVVAGPYEYMLNRGSVDASGPQTWYLRSTLQPFPPTPDYRQEVSLYDAILPMAAIYGRHLIDTLHERVGEEEQLRGRTDLGENGDTFNGAWGRLIGHYGHRDGDPVGIYGSGGPEFDYRFGALQTGLDVYRNENQDGTIDHAGLYAGRHEQIRCKHGRGLLDAVLGKQRLSRRYRAGDLV